MSPRQGKLWAITSLFNPAGYHRRLLNYRRFREALKVPLATIELSFDGRWELTDGDADILVQVADGDVMWQKERLLNQLVKRLPPECEYVAWLDSDVLLQDPEWPQRAVEKLEAVPLVQLFSKLTYLGREGNCEVGTPSIPSTAAAVLAGRSVSGILGYVNHKTGGVTSRGMAWAASRQLLEQHGFFDSCVMGGGDSALLGAAYGMPEIVERRWQMHAGHRDRYSRWAAGFHADVKGQVGNLAGEIHHLWHGDLANRRYVLRHSDLVPHCFDPYTDIRPGADGAWRWASDKPALHALLRDYFQSRQEDGQTG